MQERVERKSRPFGQIIALVGPWYAGGFYIRAHGKRPPAVFVGIYADAGGRFFVERRKKSRGFFLCKRGQR